MWGEGGGQQRWHTISVFPMLACCCRELQSVPDVWSLVEWFNWLTPENLHRRYDTVFYLCCTEDKQDPSADYEEISSTQVCACVADSCDRTQDCVTPFVVCVLCVYIHTRMVLGVMCVHPCTVCFYKSVCISLHMTIPYLVEPPHAQIFFTKSFLLLPWSHVNVLCLLRNNVNVQMGIYPYLKNDQILPVF